MLLLVLLLVLLSLVLLLPPLLSLSLLLLPPPPPLSLPPPLRVVIDLSIRSGGQASGSYFFSQTMPILRRWHHSCREQQ